MSDAISYQANPETRGTGPIQFFEASSGDLPPGTRATPRPANRPRELPPTGVTAASLQVFECEEPPDHPAVKATPRPPGRERAGDGHSAPPASAPADGR